jgi:hypothetical protein
MRREAPATKTSGALLQKGYDPECHRSTTVKGSHFRRHNHILEMALPFAYLPNGRYFAARHLENRARHLPGRTYVPCILGDYEPKTASDHVATLHKLVNIVAHGRVR